ncbi:hypothetical protein AUR40_01735 [Ehrlichia ruminantium]|nr:hypothetical protein AUR40_01735 [Ehrlichia ruminantium]
MYKKSKISYRWDLYNLSTIVFSDFKRGTLVMFYITNHTDIIFFNMAILLCRTILLIISICFEKKYLKA